MDDYQILSDFEKQVHDKFDTLSPRLQQVALYLLANRITVAFATINDIAQQANVPPSTLVRFAKTFEHKGFSNIQKMFRASMLSEIPNYAERAKLAQASDSDVTPHALLKEFSLSNIESLSNLAREVDEVDLAKATALIAKANNVFVIGIGRSFSIASYLCYSLSHLDVASYLLNGVGGTLDEQLDALMPGDLLISVSFSPYAEETVAACSYAANKGVSQLAITDHPISPLASFGDVSIVIKETKVKDAFRTLSATQCLIQSLCLSLAFQ
ncbi:hypothetical protein BIY21_16610 [Vibrio ponticus]|uniref:MurR/RpiR family transcriptional regulator n=1 Tax=Vibrio ponticus TaxID=265668 RepID=A0ABX3FDC5_9VIBR|nr:MurR/RpiR family transcriptional regulator [Vibrio ponticus]OLQ87854.1 hypothetical protein BIY21_16610 [Vibrio ponticus]